ncbi:ribonuclease P protein subunit p14 isoform 2-T2 [Odontesthes bonariensis]|uniref:ribonuclease P protein subunit p14 isoform X3 n=1 Tax=Odontesthes bonariensis TaxID=219752 RepID=UPI003F584D78
MKAVDEQEESSGYRRVVLKNASPYHYMKVHLVLEDESTRLSAVELKHFIITGLKNLHGEVGAALNFDVLKYDEDALTAFLRVYSSGLVKLWSSLTLLGFYQNQACAFRVLQVSPFLLALTGNSRDLQLD